MKKILLIAACLISPLAHSQNQTATLAGGCFWGMEEYFRKIAGVTHTRVGYAGGEAAHVNYATVSAGATGLAEAVEIEFDDSKISYETLLYHFFKMHDPTTLNRQGNDVGTQYRSAIFYNSTQQKTAASAVLAQVERSNAWKKTIITQIAATQKFYPAEEYHQKYLVKNPKGYDNHYVRPLSF